MIINAENVELVYRGFKSVYTEAYLQAPSHSEKVVMKVPSSAREETYGWMGRFPQMREWIGPRHVKGLEAYGFTIRNRRFESTVGVPRTDIADDRLAIFKPVFSEMGQHARRHPEQLVFGLLKSGFDTEGYDGQPFFDTDHPVKLNEAETVMVSNMQSGSGPAWFLLDTTRGVRPIIRAGNGKPTSFRP